MWTYLIIKEENLFGKLLSLWHKIHQQKNPLLPDSAFATLKKKNVQSDRFSCFYDSQNTKIVVHVQVPNKNWFPPWKVKLNTYIIHEKMFLWISLPPQVTMLLPSLPPFQLCSEPVYITGVWAFIPHVNRSTVCYLFF